MSIMVGVDTTIVPPSPCLTRIAIAKADRLFLTKLHRSRAGWRLPKLLVDVAVRRFHTGPVDFGAS
jgi:hypothetical protein